MSPIEFWQNLSDETKLLAKKVMIATLTLYVLLQIASIILPIALLTALIYWVYKSVFDQNPKVLR